MPDQRLQRHAGNVDAVPREAPADLYSNSTVALDPATGKLVKRERDNNGDGKVDQWWTWEGNNITIAIDKNGDGQPDPDQTITVGPNGQAIAVPTANANAGDAGAGGGGAAPPPPPPPPVLYSSSPMLGDAGAPKKKPGAKK